MTPSSEDWQQWRGAKDLQLTHIEGQLARFMTICDACRTSQNGHHSKLEDKIDRLAEVVTNLRVRMGVYVGAAAVLSVVLSNVVAYFMKHVLGG